MSLVALSATCRLVAFALGVDSHCDILKPAKPKLQVVMARCFDQASTAATRACCCSLQNGLVTHVTPITAVLLAADRKVNPRLLIIN